MARQRGNKWQGDAVVDGSRVRRQFDTRREAEAWEANPIAKRQEVTTGDVFRRCYQQLWRNTKDSRNAYRIVEELIAYQPKDVNQWDTRTVRRFISDQQSAGLTDKTINRKLAKLSKALKYAQAEGSLITMPAIEFFKEGRGRIRFLSIHEEMSLLSNLSMRHMPFANFLLWTGCRISEALNLEWKDVSETCVTFWDTKNGSNRTIPMPRLAAHAVLAQRGNNSGKPWGHIGYDEFHKDFTRAKGLAGLANDDQVVPHVLRHTCCSRLVQSGVDIRRVKDWMGHANIATTMLYAHLAPNDMVVCADALDKWSNTESKYDQKN